MAALTTQQVVITGLSPTYASCGGSGDTVEAGDGIFVHVKNGDASSHTVTVAVPGVEYGQNRPDVVVTVGAGGAEFIQIPRALADTDGRIHLTYSATTSMTIAALRA